ncbi:rubrerythrin family protein [Candidatus Berkelbacteria bacterium CG10_big_fil_rev_8_21_14_0_10_41_12]|uniref:Rubrerythrin family protein n=1 Tax=Candidatus Berkelbacteria bacterium CG10_big_fil_rev_8_21_14_0_10_41_12 TaxID=1974513 RepID=A0A2M6WWZ7_9BACT|nr:MAG: rubrerythrin family protein [Candidatus Berkelbacteria bacterium CG10_big_fil_rev_8_21_14_0_10_41_12]
MIIDDRIKRELVFAQGFEKTEYFILKKLAHRTKEGTTKNILNKLAGYSDKHYNILKKHTGKDANESDLTVLYYVITAKILGIIFCIKLLEKRENRAEKIYERLVKTHPDFQELVRDEKENEEDLIKLINEEILKYIGSVVLGLNDALVELTGALAGFTLAMQNGRLIGAAGLITGIAASFSMASSEYLSTKTEGGNKSPAKAAVYTGVAYIITVILLIFPYFIASNYLVALTIMLFNGTLIILLFSYYASVSQGTSFIKRFSENIIISFGITLISFLIGYLVRTFLHIEI